MIGWLGVAAAVSVAAAYFYRRRSRVVEVPAVTIWEQVGRPVDARSVSSLLRAIGSLLLQLMIVAAAMLAFIDPFHRAGPPARVALVIDVGATMQFAEAGGTRLAQSKQAAIQFLQTLSPDARVTIIEAAEHPLSEETDAVPPRRAIEVLGRLSARDVESDLRSALQATAFLQADPVASVVMISDFSGETPSTLRSLWHGDASLSLQQIGVDQSDVAITAAWQATAFVGDAKRRADAWRVGASLRSRRFAGRIVPVSMIHDGQTIETQSVTLSDDQTVNVEFESLVPAQTDYRLIVNGGDGLTIDDIADGVTPAAAKGVCLITDGNVPLEQALSANKMVQLRVVHPADFAGLRDESVVIVDGQNASTAWGRVADGEASCLYIGTADPANRLRLEGVLHGDFHPTQWALGHPTLRNVDADLLRIHEPFAVRASLGMVPLASVDQTPLIFELPPKDAASHRRSIFWLFDLKQTDLPTRLSFPVLLWDTIDYLAGPSGTAGEFETAPRTGEPLLLAELSNGSTVTGPDGLLRTWRPLGARFVVTDTSRQGLYTIANAPESRRIAVNLLSDRGTHSLPPATVEVAEDRIASAAIGGNLKRPSWREFAVVLAIFALAEWTLFHRKVIRVG